MSENGPFQEIPAATYQFDRRPSPKTSNDLLGVDVALQFPGEARETEESGLQTAKTAPIITANSSPWDNDHHRCTVPSGTSAFGCGDTTIRIICDASLFYSGDPVLESIPGHLDFQVCGKVMESSTLSWAQMKCRCQYFRGQPMTIAVASSPITVSEAATEVFKLIHYTIMLHSRVNTKTLSCMVELSSQLGGSWWVDEHAKWNLAMLDASASSLDDTLFGLHISGDQRDANTFGTFSNRLALNFSGLEIAQCMAKISRVAPYLKSALAPALYSINIVRRSVVLDVIAIVTRVIHEKEDEPFNLTRGQFLLSLKCRFIAPAARRIDAFDFYGLMMYIGEVAGLHDELPCAGSAEGCYHTSDARAQLFAELKSVIVRHGLSYAHAPFCVYD